MRKGITLLISISVICVSMSGAAISINNHTNNYINTEKEKFVINKPTESPEVNTQLLKSINQQVDKYLNIDKYNPEISNYIHNGPTVKTLDDVTYPWSIKEELLRSDYLQWVIRVSYGEKYFEEELDISPADFKERFLEHPLHYEYIYFDVDENGENDLKVFYSFFTSTIINTQKNIDVTSLETCLKVDAGDIPDRDEKLEVWSEIKLNFGLLPKSKDLDKPLSYNTKIKTLLENFLEKIQNKFLNGGFPLIQKLQDIFNNILQLQNNRDDLNPIVDVMAADNDWISAGIGIGSPQGEKTPIFFEKRFSVAKKNIFQPTIFEHELKETQSSVPLELLFGFKSGKANTNKPTFDIAFSIEFDPAIYVCTQFIPLEAYVYYGWDLESAHSTETKITFSANLLTGMGEDTGIALLFDSTNPIAGNQHWMSFEFEGIGFQYKANQKHNIGVLLSSPIFSSKVKFTGIPKNVKCEFDVDLSFIYQPGEKLEASADGALKLLDMGSEKMNNAILYYPKLSSDEPDIEFIKISGIPSITLGAEADLLIDNDTMTLISGEGSTSLSMGSNLDRIQMFYRKADPYDPDIIFIDVPDGVPSTQTVGVNAKLYIDLDDFSNPDNYVYGRAYRSSSGNINEISGYLPGQTDPIVKITEIPANSEAKGKLTWNKLQGYAYARRQSSGGEDPIEINIDIGTFHLYNYLQILEGIIDCNFHLADPGYFKFDTTNDMLGDTVEVEDTSTGNILNLDAYKISANDLDLQWNLDMSQSPIPIEELTVKGSVSFFEDFTISATYQGKYLQFDGDWTVGKEGQFSVDFNQNKPIELILDDLFQNNSQFTLGGGVIISDDFHFDIKWNWQEGTLAEPGYFKINEDTNDPNFDWIGIYFTYTPDGYTNPQYGIEIGGNDIGLIVWVNWYKKQGQILPEIEWYVVIMGDFYADLLWNGDWHENIQSW